MLLSLGVMGKVSSPLSLSRPTAGCVSAGSGIMGGGSGGQDSGEGAILYIVCLLFVNGPFCPSLVCCIA